MTRMHAFVLQCLLGLTIVREAHAARKKIRQNKKYDEGGHPFLELWLLLPFSPRIESCSCACVARWCLCVFVCVCVRVVLLCSTHSCRVHVVVSCFIPL